jgi:arylsulfatase A-like enzyme
MREDRLLWLPAMSRRRLLRLFQGCRASERSIRSGLFAAAAVLLPVIGACLAFTYGGLRWRGPVGPGEAVKVGAPPSFDPDPAGRDVNVVLISIDTLRADHLGCYGYGPPTSPQLDRFCERAVVFENAIAQAPATLPSHASMFTSMLPSHHGALWSTRTPLSEKVTTLAEILQARGYQTVGIHGGGQVSGELGLGQGFDRYVEIRDRFGQTVTAAVEWLQQRPAGPFFLFLHTYEVHHPYAPPPQVLELFEDGYAGALPNEITLRHCRQINGREEPPLEIDEADLDHIVATYDAGIRSVDGALARLVAALGEGGLLDDAVVIFTSDHGEEFDEHGTVGWHSHTLYDELLRVPLVLKLLGDAHGGQRVRRLVRSIDLAPTVLDVLGLPPHPSFEGMSVMSLLDSEGQPRVAVSQMDKKYDPPISSLRTSGWKLYEDRLWGRVYRARLFDLGSDPGEQRNVLASNYDVARTLATRLREIEASRQTMAGDAAEVSDELWRRLKSLGYVE